MKLVNGNMETKMIHFILMISVMMLLCFMSMFPHHRNHSIDLYQNQYTSFYVAGTLAFHAAIKLCKSMKIQKNESNISFNMVFDEILDSFEHSCCLNIHDVGSKKLLNGALNEI